MVEEEYDDVSVKDIISEKENANYDDKSKKKFLTQNKKQRIY